jgi:hypothetical protein
MADPKLRFKRSSVPGKIPTESQVPLGEIAINTYDGKVFASKNVGVGTTVYVVNPWNVGAGTDAYNINFTAGNVGIGSTLPSSKLSISGSVNVSGIVTALAFVGDGSGLTNISGQSGVTRNIDTYTATEGQTSFPATYSIVNGIAYVDVYLNGAKLSETQFTATNETSIELIEGASLDDVIEIIGLSSLNLIGAEVGIATAGGTVGTGVTLIDFRGAGISTVTVASGIATINITGGGGGTSTPDISPVMMGMIF